MGASRERSTERSTESELETVLLPGAEAVGAWEFGFVGAGCGAESNIIIHIIQVCSRINTKYIAGYLTDECIQRTSVDLPSCSCSVFIE